jgi:radical SAM superfamily enzyme YgiQ (UPF0313 family)
MKLEFINILPDPLREYVYPMLGIPILAALTPANVDITMTYLQKNQEFNVNNVDVVAFSVLTHHAPYIYSIAQKYRESGKKVILGGIHPSVLPEEALKYADTIVIGEAELLWEKILDDIKNEKLQKIYKSENYISMDLIPKSRVDLMDKSRYNNRAVIHSSRGCPFDCSFCSVTQFFGNTYRFRPIPDVIEEIRNFIESGLASGKNIIFNDDNIACNKKYSKELFLELKKLNITWSSQANLFIADDPEFLKLAAESGCISLFIGIETLNSENLQDINKSMNHINKYEDAIKKIHDAGIIVIGSFILGLDHDDESIFEKTMSFIDRTNIEIPSFSVLTPFPGTLTYRELNDQNRIIENDWSKYDLGNVVFIPKLISPEKLQQKLLEAYNLTAFRRARGYQLIAKKAKNNLKIKE